MGKRTGLEVRHHEATKMPCLVDMRIQNAVKNRLRGPDVLDNGYVIVEFDGGARAMLELCMFAEVARYQEIISAIGASGKVEAFVPGPTGFWPETLGPVPTPFIEISPRHPKRPVARQTPVEPALLEAGDHNGSTFYQHHEFLKVVRGQHRAPAVSFDDGLWSVRMWIAARQSARLGQPFLPQATAAQNAVLFFRGPRKPRVLPLGRNQLNPGDALNRKNIFVVDVGEFADQGVRPSGYIDLFVYLRIKSELFHKGGHHAAQLDFAQVRFCFPIGRKAHHPFF
jgi:hypothetical protein